ncbi:hypothetical protein ABZ835_03350 [Streptomyces sp. NPDC047461]|uniref:hypothetical protein n=1 Tax=Streptomyces sp. NPDC047461 TaxID=3155619 RepID=UPI0033C0F5B2
MEMPEEEFRREMLRIIQETNRRSREDFHAIEGEARRREEEVLLQEATERRREGRIQSAVAIGLLTLFAGALVLALTSTNALLSRWQTSGKFSPGDTPAIVASVVALATVASGLIGAVFLGLSRLYRAKGAADRDRGEGDLHRSSGEAELLHAKAKVLLARAELLRATRGLPPLPPATLDVSAPAIMPSQADG